MSETLNLVRRLAAVGEVRISDHGYDEMAEDGIYARDVVAGVANGVVVEDYPRYAKGPCVLVLENDRDGKPIHVVWGIPSGQNSPAVVVTAYRPNPLRWTDDCLRRR
jgi:hypothetical protein